MKKKNCPIIVKYDMIFVAQKVTIATVRLAKTPLIKTLGAYSSKRTR